MANQFETKVFKKQLDRATDGVIAFFTNAFGLRKAGAPILAEVDRVRFMFNIRSVVLSSLTLLAVIGVLTYNVRDVFQDALAGKNLLPDLKNFIHSLRWHGYACIAIGAAGTVLAAWVLHLRNRYQVNLLLPSLPLLLVAFCIGFRPLALSIVRAELKTLHERGARLFEAKEYDACYEYFDKWYPIVQNTYVGDNALGRMAGCHFWRRDYQSAADMYLDLLRRYPESDIRDPAITSLRWSLTKFGHDLSLDEIVDYYESRNLKSLDISVFRFLMGDACPHEPVSLDNYDILTGSHRRYVLELLDRYPEDRWAARAAFRAGLDDVLSNTNSDSEYGNAFVVIRGLQLHRAQQYADAAECYRTYLASRPGSQYRERVRDLLAVAYLGLDSLDEVFEKIVSAADQPYDISPRIDAKLIGRFAFHGSLQEMSEVIETYSDHIPSVLAADLYEVAAERALLEVDLDLAFDLRSRTDRAFLLATPGPSITPRLDRRRGRDARRRETRIYERIRATFQSVEDGGVEGFINSRLGETSQSRDKKHLFDRWYATPRMAFASVDATSYTVLLRKRGEELIRDELLASDQWVDRFRRASELVRELDDNSYAMPAVLEMLTSYLDHDLPVTPEILVEVVQISRLDIEPIHDEYLRRAVRLALGESPPNFLALQRGFTVYAISPRLAGALTLRAACETITNDAALEPDEVFERLSEVERQVRVAGYRVYLEEEILPVVAQGYLSLDGSYDVRRATRDLTHVLHAFSSPFPLGTSDPAVPRRELARRRF